MADDQIINTRSGSDECCPADGKKAWTTPQITVQSITASTHNAATTNTDSGLNLMS